MGMAASQARFLQLTARKTNVEYQGQQINQERLALSNASAGLFEKMLSIVPPTPPSSQDDKYYTQGYNFTDVKDGIQKKISWQTYSEAIASGLPPASSYLPTGLDIRSVVDGSVQSFTASTIANPTEVEKKAIFDALGIGYISPGSPAVPATPPTPAVPAIYPGYDVAHTIATAAEFISKITANPSESFILANDIDFSGITLTDSAITANFTGALDGNGFVIDGLTINAPLGASDIALFSQIGSGASVSNLNLTNTNISVSDNANRVGALAGSVLGGTIDNVTATGTSIQLGNAAFSVGGLVGFAPLGPASITNSSSDVNILGLDDCQAIGGLVGQFVTSGNIESSSSSGTINLGDNAQQVGGIAGVIVSGTVDNCYTDVALTAGLTSSLVGGFAGLAASSTNISNSYVSSPISFGAGSTNIGAFVGVLDSSTLENTTFYNYDACSLNAAGFLSGITTDDTVPLSAAQIASGTTPIDLLNPAVWDTSGATPVLNPVAFTPLAPTTPGTPGTPGTPFIPAVPPGVSNGTRQEIRYVQVEHSTYNPDGQYVLNKEPGIAVLEFDNLNRLLSVTSLTDKDYIDATNTATAADEPSVIGNGEALTYSGVFDQVTFANDMNKYEFSKAAYDYQIERISQQTKQVQSQDKSLELKMKQLDTEHNAVQTEMEAVQKVINKNIESTFKTFA